MRIIFHVCAHCYAPIGKGRQVCDTCNERLQKQYKLDWWRKHGEAWRKKRQKEKAKKNEKP